MVQFIEESTTDSDTISSADTIAPKSSYGVKKELDLDYEFIQGDDPIEFLGKYTMLIHDTDHHGRGGG